MIVEDNDRMRNFTIDYIRDLTSSITQYKNGEDAVSQYPVEKPDVVLMDIELAGTDGLSAAKQIKSEFPEARIIFLTNYDYMMYKKKAEEIGGIYIMKENLFELRQRLISLKPKKQ